MCYTVWFHVMKAKFSEIQAFCITAELGSFTAAAKHLHVTPQAISRSVTRLEARYEVQFFRRNTRLLAITEVGRTYYQTCRSALTMLQKAEQEFSDLRTTLSGDVCISVPTTFGHHRFMKVLPRFRQAYPDIHVEVEISNHTVDFVRDRVQLAIRMGPLADASFVVRRLGEFSLGVFASPEYLTKHGTPKAVADLHHHECAVFVMPRTGLLLPWVFGHSIEPLTPPASVRVRDDVLGLVSFARNHGGLIQTYHYVVEAEVARGELTEVLTSLAGSTRPFSLLYPREVATRREVRALIDFIIEYPY